MTASLPFVPPLAPMEARVRQRLPDDPGWAYEPKWDGYRALAWAGDLAATDDAAARLDSRNQRPLRRYFPELDPALAALPPGTVVDGEVVLVLDGRLDFDALQQRIHPAESRIGMLSRTTPAQIVAFDLLADRGEDLRDQPFEERRARLVTLLAGLGHPWHATPSTTDTAVAERWFDAFEAAGCDGIVAKRGPYQPGERTMVKVKHRRTVDCVVGGYRLHKHGDRVGSLLLGLYRGDQLHFIGHCASFDDAERVALLDVLRGIALSPAGGLADHGAADHEAVGSDSSGSFGTEARRPGAPSRWTGDKDLAWVEVEPRLVCEVSYDQLTGDRFRHATRLERWRPDKDPLECTFDQLELPEFGPGRPRFEDVVET